MKKILISFLCVLVMFSFANKIVAAPEDIQHSSKTTLSDDKTKNLETGGLQITSDTLPDGISGEQYGYKITSNQENVTFSLEISSVGVDRLNQAGLSLTPDGIITGTLTSEGEYTFVIVAQSETGIVSKTFTLKVKPKYEEPKEEPATVPDDKEKDKNDGNIVIIILMIVIVLLLSFIIYLLISKNKKEKNIENTETKNKNEEYNFKLEKLEDDEILNENLEQGLKQEEQKEPVQIKEQSENPEDDKKTESKEEKIKELTETKEIEKEQQEESINDVKGEENVVVNTEASVKEEPKSTEPQKHERNYVYEDENIYEIKDKHAENKNEDDCK